MIRRKPWTVRRCDAALNAITAMLAGEDGAGDWDPDHKREDLEAARDIIIDIHERLTNEGRRSKKTPFKVGDRVVRNKAVGGATALGGDVAGTILKVTAAPFGSGGTRARIRVRWDNGCEVSVEDRQLVLLEQGR